MSGPIRPLSSLQSPVFLLNSRLGLFTAATSGWPEQVRFTLLWRPFFRSYGSNLPSSLTRVHSRALGYSPCLPVSVYGTVTEQLTPEVFLGSMDSTASVLPKQDSHSPLGVASGAADLPATPSYRLTPGSSNARPAYPPASPHAQTLSGGTGILTRCPSPTPFGLGLGTD